MVSFGNSCDFGYFTKVQNTEKSSIFFGYTLTTSDVISPPATSCINGASTHIL
jgi:hypothetical protein